RGVLSPRARRAPPTIARSRFGPHLAVHRAALRQRLWRFPALVGSGVRTVYGPVLSQLSEVSAVALVRAHDARPRHHRPELFRTSLGSAREVFHHVRARAAVLLPAAHSADSRPRGRQRLLPLRLFAVPGQAPLDAAAGYAAGGLWL